jgi:hypothetical protein
MGFFSFHHGGKKLSPWWKEKNPMVERISIHIQKTYHPAEKTIKVPGKRVKPFSKSSLMRIAGKREMPLLCKRNNISKKNGEE